MGFVRRCFPLVLVIALIAPGARAQTAGTTLVALAPDRYG